MKEDIKIKKDIKKNFVLATVGDRVLGGFIDLIILVIFLYFYSKIHGVIDNVSYQRGVNISNEYSLSGWMFVFGIFLCFLLFGVMEYFTGRTPGKFVLGTMVVTEKYKKLKFWQAILRNIFRFVDFIGLYLIGLIIILLDRKNQRFGDICARTYVILSTSLDNDLNESEKSRD